MSILGDKRLVPKKVQIYIDTMTDHIRLTLVRMCVRGNKLLLFTHGQSNATIIIATQPLANFMCLFYGSHTEQTGQLARLIQALVLCLSKFSLI